MAEPRTRTSPGSPGGNSTPSRPTILASKPQGKPAEPILFSPGGSGLEKTFAASVEPMAWIRSNWNLSRNSRCSDGDRIADVEHKKRIRLKAARRLSAQGSFQSRSCEMTVGVKTDQVQRYPSIQSQNWLRWKRWGATTEPPLISVDSSV